MQNKILRIEGKGRCVFAMQDYKELDTIEICEYILIPNNQIPILKGTILNDYRFGLNGDKGDAMILLGNGSLYNHSKKGQNMIIIAEDTGAIGFVATKDIPKGDELVFDYGYTTNFVPQPPLQILFKKKETAGELNGKQNDSQSE